jgi:hypothetical protein
MRGYIYRMSKLWFKREREGGREKADGVNERYDIYYGGKWYKVLGSEISQAVTALPSLEERAILWIIFWRCQFVEYIESNGRVTDELETVWKEAVVE